MPFIDINKTKINSSINYDFTIVGAGAVGILLSIKLTNAGYKVCIIESGHFSEDSLKQKRNEILNTSKILNTAVWGRKRAIGGTTIAWGGQSLPFSKLDFQKKPWLENSGWDIGYEEVEKYYDEANKFMGIDTWGYSEKILSKLNLLDYKFQNDDFEYHVSKWANQPNFYKLYKKELRKKVDIYFNAQVISVNHQNQIAHSLKISNDFKTEYNFSISKLIIACGGIESTRILLLSKLSESNWLGKCFMEHPCIELGEIIPRDNYEIQKIFNTHILGLRKYSLRLSLTENFQKSYKVLNSSMSVMFKYESENFNPYHELKSLFYSFSFQNLFKVIKQFKYFTTTLFSLIKHGFLYKPNSKAMLTLMMEQEASIKSRMELSNELDYFSQPKLQINWEISTKSITTIEHICNASINYFNSNKLGELKIHPHILNQKQKLIDLLSGVNHHMGGTRLGSNPKTSVVDTNLKLWDFENIYVCSSSVFPTSSHSNPTLTTLALACRLVNKLIQKDEKNN